jgi:hypothetical protein
MPWDLRKTARKRVSADAFLYTTDGQPLVECRLKDISAGGARLALSVPGEVPTEFLLSLSRDGSVRRRCQIAWRAENQIGVRFVATQPA